MSTSSTPTPDPGEPGLLARIRSWFAPAPPAVSGEASTAVSQAEDEIAYRAEAAAHLYARYAVRVHQGILPSPLYAIAVVRTDIDAAGRIQRLHWLRQPGHAPEVTEEIEQLLRAAAPFPAAAQLGAVSYTETWLWDESGQFQLQTLTEGQE
ncbi:MAG: hypothetical protein ACN6O3_20090 [Comamonas sp.]